MLAFPFRISPKVTARSIQSPFDEANERLENPLQRALLSSLLQSLFSLAFSHFSPFRVGRKVATQEASRVLGSAVGTNAVVSVFVFVAVYWKVSPTDATDNFNHCGSPFRW